MAAVVEADGEVMAQKVGVGEGVVAEDLGRQSQEEEGLGQAS